VERLLRSTFAVTSNAIELGARPKVPFTIRWEEGPPSAACDVRLAGFGPLFSGALLLSAAACLLSRRRAAVAASLVAVALLGTVLVTAEGWWARFAPQLWLVPVVLAVAALAERARWSRIFGALSILALAGDVAFIAVNHLNRGGWTQRELRGQLASLARMPGPLEVRLGCFEAVGVRLSEAGVRWRPTTELGCEKPFELAGSFTVRMCAPGGAAPAP
jgi:hypothetical protein